MNCYRIGLSALALLFVSTAVATAQLPQNPEKQDSDSLNKILKRLEDMEKGLSDSFKYMQQDITKLQMEALKGRVTVEKVLRLEDQVKRLQADLDEMRKPSSARPSFSIDPNKQTVSELEEIRSRLLDMERLLRAAQKQPRVAFSAPVTGRLRLVNTYPETLEFVVNNVSYPVEPGGTRQVEGVPAGPINYYVVSSLWGRGVQSGNVIAGDTFVITAR